MKLHAFWVCFAIALSLTTGCGIITAEDAAGELSDSYCKKMSECQAAAFKLAYPGGVAECVEKGVSAIPEADRGKRSACDSSEIDTCTTEIDAIKCDDFQLGAGGLPASCQGC